MGSLYYSRLASTGGDFSAAVRDGFVLIVAFVAVALAIAIADIVVDRRGQP